MKIIIGIDPDVTASGVGVLQVTEDEAKYVYIGNIPLYDMPAFFDKYAAMVALHEKGEVIVRLESAGLVGVTFNQYGDYVKSLAGFLRRSHPNAEAAAVKCVSMKANKVGRNSEIANQIVQILEKKKIRYSLISPTQRQRCDSDELKRLTANEIRETVIAKSSNGSHVMLSKMDRKRFNTLTNWSKMTNNDNRDAALLMLSNFLIKNKI